MSTEDPPPPTHTIDSDDEAISPSEATKQSEILSSYKDYLNEIQEELPLVADAEAGTRTALDPDEETIGDHTLDPPEEDVPLTPRRGPFRRFRERRARNRNRQDVEQDDELDEMYQELGVARPSRNVPYTHPLLHRLQDKKCLGLLGVILVIALAVSLSGRDEALSLLTEEEDKLHDMLHNSGSKTDGSEVLSEAQRESEEYRKVTEEFMPTWHSREEGWEGQSYDEGILFCAGMGRILCPYEAYCPLGKETTPLGGGQAVPQSWAPLIDYEDGWVQIGKTGQCNQWKDMYTEPPAWGESGAGSEIITEHIMCCAPHKVDNQERPGASTSSNKPAGGGATAMDKPTSNQPDANWEQTVFQNANPQAQYSVNWYSRATGWDGSTYTEALKFCGLKKTIVCPYEEICPGGDYSNPIGGEKLPPSGGIAWAPVVDRKKGKNWVAVSRPNLCNKYTQLHANLPGWGDHGGNNDETQNVACCKITGVAATSDTDASKGSSGSDVYVPVDPSGSSDAESAPDNMISQPTPSETDAGPPPTPKPTMEPTDPPTVKVTTISPTTRPTTLPTVPPTTPTVTEYREKSPSPTPSAQGKSTEMLHQAISDIHKPIWFDRDSGWSGKSWGEAQEFCASQIGEGNLRMKLCQLGVYCPLPHQSPMQGPRKAPSDDDRGAWAPFGNLANGWVRVDDDAQSCTVYNTIFGTTPDWGFSGEGAEAITQNILCCKSTHTTSTSEPTKAPVKTSVAVPSSNKEPTPVSSPVVSSEAIVVTEKPTNDVIVAATFDKTKDKYMPLWFDRSAWKGTSYLDALEFCGERGWSLCPYEAYCPLGPGPHLYDGVKNEASSWAPVIDVPNGWVQVGAEETCEPYNSLHPHPPLWGLNGEGNEDLSAHIMCCSGGVVTAAETIDFANKPEIYGTPFAMEQTVLDKFHPVWFQRKHGYAGTTHEESIDFCKHVGDMELCPLAAYCPNGESGNLFYGREAFSGEQWAPIKTDDSAADWVMVGSTDGASMCQTYLDAYGSPTPWASDGSSAGKKQHILCCQKQVLVTDPETGDDLSMEDIMRQQLKPIWYGEDHGWNGGSHNDAQLFCSASGKRELCPYVAYCPYGKGTAPMGGHVIDFKELGPQWAPVNGLDNHWVQIGVEYENVATRCMTYNELRGEDGPAWGVNTENEPEKKKFIMCCNKSQ